MSASFVPSIRFASTVPPLLMMRRLSELSVIAPPGQKRLPKTQSYPCRITSKNGGMSAGSWLKPASISRIQSQP
ncbi:MAG: hypothetical protein QOE14_247 [Humisphaera sp.]|nr:hypothetical protein [Humisphaera sp.]